MVAFPNDMNGFTGVFTKACEDANALMTGYIGAATKSAAATLQGVEDITRSVTDLMQESFARTIGASKTIMAAKSPQEAADTHAEFMKDSFDNIVASGSKLSEISLHTTKGAIDPLAQHANEAMGSVMKKAKAG